MAREPAPAGTSRFTGRIDRRLSVVLALALAVLLLVGGTSIYLLGSLLLEAEPIARQSEQVFTVEVLHTALLDFAGVIELAHVQGMPVAEAVRTAYSTRLDALVTRYRAAGGAIADVQEMRDLVAEAGRLAVTGGARASRPVGAPGVDQLDRWRAIRARMDALAERVSAGHGATEQRQIRLTYGTLRLTIGVNIAFVVAGVVLLLAAQRYFRRAIAVPLRQLADCSSAIATGEPYRAMPVTSTDEIGRLTDAFNRMAQQLREHEDRLKGLVALEERQRLACELHDSLSQDLALLRLTLVEADHALGLQASAATSEVVQRMFATLDVAYQNLREAIFGLRALDLATPGGFIAALEDHLADFSRLRKVPVELDVRARDAVRLAPHVQTQLSRIVHEALSNVARHAAATRASVTLDADASTVRVTIVDDGVGFDVEAAANDARHFGLRTMKERAESVGGTLLIESSSTRGTRIIVELPRERA